MVTKTIWNVRWSPPREHLIGLIPIQSLDSVKAFGSREKAEEFYGKLLDASRLIGVDVKMKIEEVKLEA